MNREASLPTAHDGLVTIVLTTCDRPEVVGRALRSALGQSYRRIEVIVVDDGINHPVDLAGLLDTFAPADGRNIPTVELARTAGRQGANSARNLGLARAVGDWILFLDDDDELRPEMVDASLAVAAASQLPAPVAVVSGIEEVKTGRVVLRHIPTESSPKGGAYRISSTATEVKTGLAAFNTLVAPTGVIREIGGFDEEIRAAMHTDLFLRVNSVCSIQCLDQITYSMHHHGGQRRSTAYLDRAEGTARTLQKHRDLYARYPRAAAVTLANIARYYLLAGRWRPAVRAAAQAIRNDPTSRTAQRMLLASFTGPKGYAVLRRLAGRRRGEAVSNRAEVT